MCSWHKNFCNRVTRKTNWNRNYVSFMVTITYWLTYTTCMYLNSLTTFFHGFSFLSPRIVVWSVNLPIETYFGLKHFDWVWICMADDASIAGDTCSVDAPFFTPFEVQAIPSFSALFLVLYLLNEFMRFYQR